MLRFVGFVHPPPPQVLSGSIVVSIFINILVIIFAMLWVHPIHKLKFQFCTNLLSVFKTGTMYQRQHNQNYESEPTWTQWWTVVWAAVASVLSPQQHYPKGPTCCGEVPACLETPWIRTCKIVKKKSTESISNKILGFIRLHNSPLDTPETDSCRDSLETSDSCQVSHQWCSTKHSRKTPSPGHTEDNQKLSLEHSSLYSINAMQFKFHEKNWTM